MFIFQATKAITMRIAHCGNADDLILRTRGFLCAFFLLALCSSAGWSAPSDAFLDMPLDEFHASRSDAFYDLCRSLNRPCGAEYAPNEKIYDRQGTDLNLTKTSAREILDEIIRLFPGYHWAIQNDVLIFEPERRTDKDMLAKKLGYVSFHQKSSHKAARIVLAQARLQAGQAHIGPPFEYVRIDLKLRNVTVREALNAIVKADGQAVWSFIPEVPGKHACGFSLSSWRTSGITDFDEKIDSCSPVRRWLIRLRLKWNILLPVDLTPCHEK